MYLIIKKIVPQKWNMPIGIHFLKKICYIIACSTTTIWTTSINQSNKTQEKLELEFKKIQKCIFHMNKITFLKA